MLSWPMPHLLFKISGLLTQGHCKPINFSFFASQRLCIYMMSSYIQLSTTVAPITAHWRRIIAFAASLLVLHLKIPSHIPLGSFLHLGHTTLLLIAPIQHISFALPAVEHPFPTERLLGIPLICGDSDTGPCRSAGAVLSLQIQQHGSVAAQQS